jgi:phage tail-like protein
MARKRQDDFIQSFRFHVVEPTGTFLTATAGFKTVTVPDKSLAPAEYRDGLTLYTVKQPGIPTIGTATLAQGATKKQSEFFKWMKACAEGAEYRADLQIVVHDNSNVSPPNVVKEIDLFECFPLRNKPIGDLDSTNSEINVRELEVAVEQWEEKT